MNQSTSPLQAHSNAPAFFEAISIGDTTKVTAAAIAGGDLAGLKAVLRQLQLDPNGKEKVEKIGQQLSQMFDASIVGYSDSNGTIKLSFQSPNQFAPLFFEPWMGL